MIQDVFGSHHKSRDSEFYMSHYQKGAATDRGFVFLTISPANH